jgi:hypothetical protein
VRPLTARTPTEDERLRLERGLRDGQRRVQRWSAIILRSATGRHAPEIAHGLGCHVQTVRAVIRAFNDRRVPFLHPRRRSAWGLRDGVEARRLRDVSGAQVRGHRSHGLLTPPGPDGRWAESEVDRFAADLDLGDTAFALDGRAVLFKAMHGHAFPVPEEVLRENVRHLLRRLRGLRRRMGRVLDAERAWMRQLEAGSGGVCQSRLPPTWRPLLRRKRWLQLLDDVDPERFEQRATYCCWVVAHVLPLVTGGAPEFATDKLRGDRLAGRRFAEHVALLTVLDLAAAEAAGRAGGRVRREAGPTQGRGSGKMAPASTTPG